jgi:hypothetical protein
VGPTAVLDAVVKRETFCPWRDSNPCLYYCFVITGRASNHRKITSSVETPVQHKLKRADGHIPGHYVMRSLSELCSENK